MAAAKIVHVEGNHPINIGINNEGQLFAICPICKLMWVGKLEPTPWPEDLQNVDGGEVTGMAAFDAIMNVD